jgi:hypothetical protein
MDNVHNFSPCIFYGFNGFRFLFSKINVLRVGRAFACFQIPLQAQDILKDEHYDSDRESHGDDYYQGAWECPICGKKGRTGCETSPSAAEHAAIEEIIEQHV